MSITESIVANASLVWFGELGVAGLAAELKGTVAESATVQIKERKP